MLLIRNIKLNINENEDSLREKIIKRLHTKDRNFSYTIHKKSIDGRDELKIVYQVLVRIDNEYIYLKHKDVTKYQKEELHFPTVKTNDKPIIIGYGPSGMFAAIKLLDSGIKSIVFEKGKRIKERQKDVEDFINNGILNEKSNIQYGEGGAGAFSDAKLTTRIKNKYIDYILDTLVRFGADRSIKYESHPHVGSDAIKPVISAITNHLIQSGVEFHFEEEVKDFVIEDNTLKKIITDKGNYSSNSFILAIGHSSFETIKKLYEKNVYMEPKDISIGFRVEHSQKLIDSNQYKNINNKNLKPSEYFLTYKDERNVYSFCMCPGGYVIPSTSIKGHVCTNGMSNAARDSGIANSAILIQINKEEFDKDTLSGFEYIYNIERKAYDASNSYKALSQNIKDYIDNKTSNLIFESSYSLGTHVYDFNNLFTDKQNEIIKKAFKSFDYKIKGFINEGIMVGPETRTTSPIRINRDENCESINTRNLYLGGEGAGYGGGIMSCALDGIRIADIIINKYL